MKKNILSTACMGLLFCSASSFASITISYQFGEFTNADGTTNIPVGSLGIIVADTLTNGFTSTTTATSSPLLNNTLSMGNFLGGSDDQIVSVFQATPTGSGGNGFLPGSVNYSSTIFPNGSQFPNWDQNDPLAIYWFPTLNTVGATITANTPFGFFTSATTNAPSGGTWPLITPPNGTTKTIAYFSTNLATGSGISKSTTFSANQIVAVPEPSIISYLAASMAILAFWQRGRRMS